MNRFIYNYVSVKQVAKKICLPCYRDNFGIELLSIHA